MKRLLPIILTLALVAFITDCGSKTEKAAATGTPIKAVPVNNFTATLSNNTGQLKQGPQDVTLAFTDSSGKSVDVGAVSLNFHMPKMGGMSEMNDSVSFTTTDTPGVYRGKVNVEVAGEWQAQLAFEGPAGKGKTTFSVTAR